jgi:hypothetical protein
MSGGYVKIARGIFKHNMFKDESYSEREAWIWLICGASYKDDTIRIPNTNIVTKIKRGEYMASYRFLATKFKWPISRVKRFIDRLKSGTMLNTRVVQGITFITIENYDEYQFFVQQRNSVEYTTTPKSGTNISKEVNKRSIYTSNFNKLWELIPSKMRKSKGGAYKAFKSIKTKLTIEELGHRYQQHHRINKDYTKHPATWLHQECWLDDEVQNSTNEPTLIERMKKLGYAHRGSEDQYEQFSKDNKNYKIHRFKKEAVIEPD